MRLVHKAHCTLTHTHTRTHLRRDYPSQPSRNVSRTLARLATPPALVGRLEAKPLNRGLSRSLTSLRAHSDYKRDATSINSLNLPNFVFTIHSHTRVHVHTCMQSDNCLTLPGRRQKYINEGRALVMGSQDNQLKFIDCIYNTRDATGSSSMRRPSSHTPHTHTQTSAHVQRARRFGNLTRYHLC